MDVVRAMIAPIAGSGLRIYFLASFQIARSGVVLYRFDLKFVTP
jgi:hypothetical protein